MPYAGIRKGTDVLEEVQFTITAAFFRRPGLSSDSRVFFLVSRGCAQMFDADKIDLNDFDKIAIILPLSPPPKGGNLIYTKESA